MNGRTEGRKNEPTNEFLNKLSLSARRGYYGWSAISNKIQIQVFRFSRFLIFNVDISFRISKPSQTLQVDAWQADARKLCLRLSQTGPVFRAISFCSSSSCSAFQGHGPPPALDCVAQRSRVLLCLIVPRFRILMHYVKKVVHLFLVKASSSARSMKRPEMANIS